MVDTNRAHANRLAVAALLAAIGCSAPERTGHEASVASVKQQLEESGSAVVSVVLSAAPLVDAQAEVGLALSGTGSEVIHNFQVTPGMTIEIGSEEALTVLASHPSVERFDPSPAGGTNLDDSREIVGANPAFNLGFNGAGRVVGILDTGIAQTHQDLADDLLDEACICNTGVGCCPNGTNMQFGPGAAPDDAGHGTHVSGIVSSAGTVAPRGIAPDADLVMVRMMNGNVFSSADDITASLEWLLSNHPEVDSINMSLGTFQLFQADCDVPTPTFTPPAFIVNMANVVAALNNAGVSVVASSGNDGSKTAMSAPACLSNVIAVGNTTKSNAINLGSNSNEGLAILAPGTSIVSTFPPDTIASLTGTSMSAPHVAAAAALLRQLDAGLGVEEVLECLTTSPTALTDTNGVTRPLLHIPSALEACGDDAACNRATYEAESMTHNVGGPFPPDGWNVWSNGDITQLHDFTPGPARITVRAFGQPALGIFPHMVVSVGGTPIGDVTVNATSYTDYSFDFVATGGSQLISVAFDNDFFQPPEDRNLIVDQVSVDCALSGELPLFTDWGSGYCMGVWLTNEGSQPTTTWQASHSTWRS